jgi:heat shock protein HslJ
MEVAGRVELVGVEWTLLRLVADGVESVPGEYPLEVTLGITGTGALMATDGCNWVSGRVEVEADRLVAGQLMTTRRGCFGPVVQVAPLIERVLHSSPTWVIHDGTLTLTSADATLVYEPRRSIFPSDRAGRPAPLVITEGRRGSADYRFDYSVSEQGVGLAVEWREEPGGAWNYSGLMLEHDWNGPQPNPMACTAASIGDDRVIAGLVIEPATKVTFRPIGGQDVDLDLYQLPEAPRHLAYI